PSNPVVTPSHFFTADANEAASLSRPGSGWVPEGVAFRENLPDALGRCEGSEPVYRLYNNRGAQGDDNHRYVASASERDRMVARGWVSEGIAWCTYGSEYLENSSIKSFLFTPTDSVRIGPAAVC